MFKRMNRSRDCDRSREGQDGIVIIIVALLTVVMFGFVALGVTTGYLYSARADVQQLADAAALAGTVTFVFTPFAQQPETAEANAVSVAVGQGAVMQYPVSASDVSVNVDVAKRRVQVDIETSQPTFFARILGIDSAGVNARAHAEASATSFGASCIKPWFIPSSLLLTADQDLCQACAGADSDGAGPDVEGFEDGPLLLWASDELDTNGDAVMQATGVVWDLVQGYAAGTISPYPMRPTSPSGAITEGQFYSLSIEGTGADLFEEAIAECVDQVFSCFREYPTEPGAMTGPTRAGAEALIGDPPAVIEFGSSGEWVSWQFTRDGGQTYTRTDRQLSVAPIWDSCNATNSEGLTYCESGAFQSGRHNIKIVGFAMIFIESFASNAVMGRILNVVPCAANSGGLGDPESGGILSRPMNLVRVLEEQ